MVILVLVVLVAAGGGMASSGGPGQAAGDDPARSFYDSFAIETIESTPGIRVGQSVSVATDSGSGKIRISHYDASNGDLRQAASVASGGNCGEQGGWSCSIVDGAGSEDVGQASSLALQPETQSQTLHWPRIAYHNATDRSLQYASYNIPGTWHYATVDTPGTPETRIGEYASLALDSEGIPHIAYYYYTFYLSDYHQLRHATYVGGGWGNCGGGDWQCEVVETWVGGGIIGTHGSLDLSAGGNPSIAYYWSGNLAFATKGGSAPNCGPGNSTWTCSLVDQAPGVGKYAAFARDQSSGIGHIAYYDAVNEVLKYAVTVGSGGNCDTSGLWQCDEIDRMGSSLTHMGIALAIDSNGYPFIAYQQTSESGPAVLRVARPGNALGLLFGNCGPESGGIPTWACGTVDEGGADRSVGDYLDLALTDDDRAIIAYYESDSYQLSGNLKIAVQEDGGGRYSQVYLPFIGR
jgi:hypothetical protein